MSSIWPANEKVGKMLAREKGPIWAALSGGVDSATAASLLLEQGFRVEAVFMELWDCGLAKRTGRQTCCSPRDKRDAMEVARQLGVEFRAVDLRGVFRETVIKDFVDSYLSGLTPNPCVRCNQWVKYGALLQMALESGAQGLATGHYARVAPQGEEGPLRLLRGRDPSKDQSYFLFTLGQEELKRIIWPLGELTKEEVRAIARKKGLCVAEKEESQEVCFIPGGDYREFLSLYAEGDLGGHGDIVDWEGRKLGEHDGFFGFTVGQRRGLRISWKEPLYVLRVIPKERKIVVGPRSRVNSMGLEAKDFSWVKGEPPGSKFSAKARIRYRHKEAEATVEVISEKRVRVLFQEPQPSVTPGQAVVLYSGEEVLGGGWIQGPWP